MLILPEVLAASDGLSITLAEPMFEGAFIATLKGHRTATPEITMVSHEPVSAASDDGVVIEVCDLQQRFGNFYAVKGISFSVQRGEIFGLPGANGAGKTTMFRRLCGLLPASEGKAPVVGLDLCCAAARVRGRLRCMVQRFSLFVDLTVLQNLRFFASPYGLKRLRAKQRIVQALEVVELSDCADAPRGDQPLGYKQRLSMAAALMHEPDILSLYEPTTGVDPLVRREFWQRINALAESGVTVVSPRS
jgi:ABC-2 type transport system ATP-binding protein